MSNFDGPLSTQPEWQGHYSFLPPGEPNIFAQPFEQVSGSSSSNDIPAQPRPSSAHNSTLETSNQSGQSTVDSETNHSRALDPLGLRAPKAESPAHEMPESRSGVYGIKAESTQEDSLVSTDTPGLSLGSNPLSSVSSAGQGQENAQSQAANDDATLGKDEDDEVLDDDEMLEADGDGDGEGSTQPQTAAERTAARRKMKRFR
jgi:hypothetical protein